MTTVLLVLGVIGATIFGDYLIKAASLAQAGLLSVQFLAGAAVYGATAIGFYVLMKSNSLATVGVFYSAATIILMALLGACCL